MKFDKFSISYLPTMFNESKSDENDLQVTLHIFISSDY